MYKLCAYPADFKSQPPVVSFYSYNGQDQKKGQTFLKLFLIIFDSYLVNGLPLSCATFLWYNLKQADAVTNTHNVQE